MLRGFSPRAQRLVIALGPDEAYTIGSKQLEPEHILLSLLKSADGLGYVTLKVLKINVLTLQLAIEQSMPARLPNLDLYDLPHSERLKWLLGEAKKELSLLQCDYVGTEHLLLACIKENHSLSQRYFAKAGLSIERIRETVVEVERKLPSSAKLDDGEKVVQNILPNQADSSYEREDERKRETFLSHYSRDITQDARAGELDPVVGREQEILRAIQILSRRTKNNPVLVGEPGVGKTAIVEGLALKISRGDVPPDLQKKRILSLDLAALIAGTKYRGEFEERMKRMMKEICESKDIILFVDELHTIIGAGGPEGSMDASNMLKPALSRGEIQMIGATTTKEYRKYLEKDSALTRRFQMIQVEEPNAGDTQKILNGLKKYYEDYHKVIYDDDAISSIVEYSTRYIPERFLPDKAIDLLDEAGATKKIGVLKRPKEIEELEQKIEQLSEEKRTLVANQNYEDAALVRDKVSELRRKLEEINSMWNFKEKSKRPHVTKEDIGQVISTMTGIPCEQLDDGETERLLDMEKILHKEVVGQNEAVRLISSAVRRNRAGVSSIHRPIGSFIFLGPTGVGKTQLAKSVAKFIFGTEDSIIRVDMSDFMEKPTASRLVGAPPGYIGYEEGGILTEKVRRHPYSVVLLDEIEKAHPDVFNLLLQLLEEGELSDNLGHTVSFRNTIIIMTSNAGARQISNENRLGFSSFREGLLPYDEMKAGAMEELKKLMSPELLNRIDDVIVFTALNKEQVNAILDIQLAELENRLLEKGLTLTVKQKARDYLVENGYEQAMGARPMRRLLQREIEDRLADLLLSKKQGNSQSVIVDSDGEKISVRFKRTLQLKGLESQVATEGILSYTSNEDAK